MCIFSPNLRIEHRAEFQANMVLINPASEGDEESMRERMELRRAREKAEKKAKKEGGKKRGGETNFKVPGRHSIQC